MNDSKLPTPPARTLQFWGASDDLCEITGARTDLDEPEEFSPMDIDGRFYTAVVKVSHDDIGLLVSWVYTGRWIIGIGPLYDGAEMPDWPMRWKFGHKYSDYTAVLEIDVPAGVSISFLPNSYKEEY